VAGIPIQRDIEYPVSTRNSQPVTRNLQLVIGLVLILI